MEVERTAPPGPIDEIRFNLLGKVTEQKLETADPLSGKSVNNVVKQRAVAEWKQGDREVLVDPMHGGRTGSGNDDGDHWRAAPMRARMTRARKTKLPRK
jgi:hypothetical protein